MRKRELRAWVSRSSGLVGRIFPPFGRCGEPEGGECSVLGGSCKSSRAGAAALPPFPRFPLRMMSLGGRGNRGGREGIMAHYLIGIDLGTTNSALAYIDLRRKGPGRQAGHPDRSPIPQLVAPGELAERPLLPSFLYLPGPHDLPAGATALPWDADAGLRRRRVRPQSRGEGAGPARHVRQVLALSCRRRSLGAALALDCTAGRAAHLAGRGFGALSAPPRREPGTTPWRTTGRTTAWKSSRWC